jgi:molybdopterin-containing oxidoreductase family membrane subunit
MQLMIDGIREAATRPMFKPGKWWKILAAFLGLLVLAGLGTYIYQFTRGLGVTALNDGVFYGFYMTNLVTFIGISYGGAVVSAILRLTHAAWRAPITRLAEGMAVVSLIIGASFAIVDMGRLQHLWWVLVTPNPQSPVVWDIVAIGTYVVATLIFFFLPLIPDAAIMLNNSAHKLSTWRQKLYSTISLKWKGLPGQRTTLSRMMTLMAILIIPLAVSVHSVLAWVFAVTSREGWLSSIFGPYFVVGALFSGVAAVILVVSAFRKVYHLENFIGQKQFRYLGLLMLALGATYLYFTIAEFLTEGYVQYISTVPFLRSLLVADYAPLFWPFLILGIIIPVLLVAIPRTRNVKGVTIASALVVAGMWIKRFLIIVPPLRQGLFGTSVPAYTGNWVEWVITLGAAAAVPFFLMMLFRLFPVLPIYEMQEIAEEQSEHESKAVDLAGLETE